MTFQMSPSPSGRLLRVGAYFSAAMMAALVAAEFVAVDGLLAYAADGIFGLGHQSAYAVGILVGVPSAWVSWRVFRSALAWELNELAPRASGDAITES